jgi:Skp family chaperone for outer membrane proteins
MNTPKTTKLTLKRIVEAVQDGSLPDNGFGDKPEPMSADKKKKLMELAGMYEKFGECLQNEESLMNAAKGLTELCELAESYALNECGEWFQQQIVQKDMKELKRRVGEFQKVVQETYARMQQAGVSYQDIGHILGRYYDLKGNKGMDQQYQQVPGPQPLQEKKK